MTPDRRSRIQSHPKYRWLVLVTVASGMMMAILSSSIVNIALPGISVDFGSSISTTAWVASIYMIMQAAFMPVSGRMGDLFGHRNIFIAGLLIFTVMSVLCTFSWNIYSLIAGRGLMAIGTSAMSPMALAFVMDAFPGRERAQALGIMGGLMGSAPALGLVGGGFLVEAFGWRSVFLVAVPLCLMIAPVALFVLKGQEKRAERYGFDMPGAVLLSAGLFGGLLALSEGGDWGWTNARTLAGVVTFASLTALFIFWENRSDRPLLDLGLFKFRSLVSANLAAMFTSAAMFGTFVMLPFFFQSVAGDSPIVTGLKMAPLALTFLFMAPLGGRLPTRIGARSTPLIGLLIAAAGYLAISRVIAIDVSPLVIGLAIALAGVGLGLTNAPVTTAALHDVPPDKRGVAAALPQMSRFIGGSFGMVLVSSVLSWRVTTHLLAAGTPVDQAAAGAAISENTADIVQNPMAQQAFAAGFQDAFLFTLVLVAAAMLAAAFVPQLKHRQE